MGEHGEPGGALEPRVEPDIDGAHQLRDAGRAGVELCEDRRFAGVTVRDVLANEIGASRTTPPWPGR